MSGPPVRVGVIGTGALGFHHARLLRRMPGTAFAGIYDKNPARAAEVAATLETVAHPSLEALLECVDAVTVAVPTPAHTTVGLAVLERGLALLMEKPLADSLDGADQLVRRAAGQGVVLQVGHVERFNRAVRAAAPYLDEPRFLQVDRLAPFQPRGSDVAVVLDLMIHDLDLVLELVGAAVSDVRATGVAILTPHVDRHRHAHRQPRVARAHAPASHLPADGLLLPRPGAGQRRFFPAQTGLAGARRDEARADRRARAARRPGSGAARPRAGELRTGRAS